MPSLQVIRVRQKQPTRTPARIKAQVRMLFANPWLPPRLRRGRRQEHPLPDAAHVIRRLVFLGAVFFAGILFYLPLTKDGFISIVETRMFPASLLAFLDIFPAPQAACNCLAPPCRPFRSAAV